MREHELYDTRQKTVHERFATKCYFLLHREAWIDIGRRNARMIRAKERCFAWVSSSVPLLLYERKDIKEREVLLYLLLSCFFARGRMQGARTGARSVTFGCTDQPISTWMIFARGADLGDLFHRGVLISYPILTKVFFFFFFGCRGVADGWQYLPRWILLTCFLPQFSLSSSYPWHLF